MNIGKFVPSGKVAALPGVVLMCMLMPGILPAQQKCDPSPFLAATRWTGTVTTTVSGSGTITEANGDTVTYRINESQTMSPSVGPLSGNSFFGTENATVNVNNSFAVLPPGTTIPSVTIDAASGHFTEPGTPTAILTFANCSYFLGTVPALVLGTEKIDGNSQPAYLGVGPLNGPNGAPPLEAIWNVSLPTSGTTLSGSISFTAPASSSIDGGSYPVQITTTWSLTPVEDLEVIVTIPDYQTWRPTAGLNERETGLDPLTLKFNYLLIKARLVQKSTQQVVAFSPDKWNFSLVQVSHEPGVTMNWPNKILAGEESDMSFDKQACATPVGCMPIPTNTAFTITPDDPNFPNGATKAELLSPDPLTYASTQILLSPHDWGGWATLNVSATVGDQIILGHLELPPPAVNTSNETDILLPQRQAGSFVADNWKKDKQLPLSTPDEDDSESKPNGDGRTGDGLTLYEEYRGFYMGCVESSFPPTPEGTGGCQRVEGNPLEKDLFVVDKMPTVASDGVKTFKESSGLNVHYLDMTVDDISASDLLNPGGERVINFNHLAAPHEVDQHALVIDLGSQSGVSETEPEPGRLAPGLPKDIARIAVDKNYQLYPVEYIRRMIAHELGHSVDVYHHGKTDMGNTIWKLESSGAITERGSVIYVKTEDDDLSVLKSTVMVEKLGFEPNVSKVPIWVGNNISAGTVIQHGQHSGDQSSFMRYIAAEAYIPDGFPKVRIWLGSHNEPYGFQLGDSPAGTGVNDPDRKPRERYGAAYAGNGAPNCERGNNASQLSVNDKYEAINRNSPPCP